MTLIGGTRFVVDDKSVRLGSPAVEAKIRRVFDDKIALSKPLPAGTVGGVMLADRAPAKSAYWIKAVEGKTVHISPTTWIGRGRSGSIDEKTGTIVDGREIFPFGDIISRDSWIGDGRIGKQEMYRICPTWHRNYYAGAWMVSSDTGAYYRIKRGDNEGFILDPKQDLSKLTEDFPKDGEFLLYDVGPGDKVKFLNYKIVNID
jgi:hypothetical protein